MNGSISMKSKFDEICAKIEQKLGGKDSGIVEINFPVGELSNLELCKDIHNAFNTEIIGDNLFIKCDGGEKEKIHTRLKISLENQNQDWWTSSNTICTVRRNQYRPDVGVWFRSPTRLQRRMPIAYSCPPPNVWIEQYTTGIEFVAIGLSSGLGPFRPKPETEMMDHATSQLTRPARAPYACHWDLNRNEIWLYLHAKLFWGPEIAILGKKVEIVFHRRRNYFI
ncbi:hypothetical protein Glove_295g41 [Diversispora epigaea]|uniref:Uncharacterized protein n=1 Tax=Diversispora epigaea TaxID=1348612 RepID=A0A397I042_9GLOM|nr:hypothetical protein Glove_295g41 [Diversispora epigaea]